MIELFVTRDNQFYMSKLVSSNTNMKTPRNIIYIKCAEISFYSLPIYIYIYNINT